LVHVKQTIRQVITVDKKTYATGLFWQPLSVGRRQDIIIRQTARSLIGGAQFHCLKTTGAAQFGLGFSSKGHKKNQFVAAASIADALRDKPSSLCAFKVPEGWWLIVIRNGLILPEDDFLFEKEDDAKESFKKLMSLPDWGYKIAPNDWHLDNTTEMTASQLFEKGRPIRLMDLAKKSILKLLLILAGVLLVSAYLFQDTVLRLLLPPPPKPTRPVVRIKPKTQTNPALAKYGKPKAPAIKQDNKTVSAIKKVIPKAPAITFTPPPAPWTKIQNPKQFANACELAIKFFNQPVPGWKLSSVVCNSTEIKADFRRKEKGILAMMLKASDALFKSTEFEIEKRGDTATATLKMLPIGLENIPPAEKKETIINRFINFSQRTGFAIKTTYVKDTIKHPKNVMVSTDFSFVNFEFSSKIDIKEWANMLYTLGAIEWREIKWNHDNKEWEAEGRVYERE